MKKLPLLILSISCITTVFGREYYGNGYAIIEESVLSDDLQVVVYRKISGDNLYTALIELLDGTGWQLASTLAADPYIHRLYQQKLPQQKRNIGPIQLDKALQWFAGDAWDLVVDPVNKLISFDLKPQYRPKPIIATIENKESQSEDVIK